MLHPEVRHFFASFPDEHGNFLVRLGVAIGSFSRLSEGERKQVLAIQTALRNLTPERQSDGLCLLYFHLLQAVSELNRAECTVATLTARLAADSGQEAHAPRRHFRGTSCKVMLPGVRWVSAVRRMGHALLGSRKPPGDGFLDVQSSLHQIVRTVATIAGQLHRGELSRPGAAEALDRVAAAIVAVARMLGDTSPNPN